MEVNTFKRTRLINLLLVTQLISSLSVYSSEARAWVPGITQSAMRDRAREIERVERDRELNNKPIPPKKDDDSARLILLKQSKEDFKVLQGVNNKMMADAWDHDDLDYGSISESISQIRSRAVRLRSSLALPKTEEEKQPDKKPADLTTASVKEFRAALLRLDKSIMNFVTNPLFKDSAVVEMDLATRASHDLEMVIEQSETLQKVARSLTKKSKDTHE